MKKWLSLIPAIFFGATAIADDLYEGAWRGFSVISSTYSESVPAGLCKITGRAIDAKNSASMTGIEISQGDKTVGRTDADGKFALLISVDKPVYFFIRDSMETEIPVGIFTERHITEVEVRMGDEQPMMMRKPVIYLYNELSAEVSIKVVPHGAFTFTYPDYNGGWNVKTSANGTISNLADGKEYPYLFWEARTNSLSYQISADGSMKGVVIAKADVVDFLEASLTQLGLTQSEQTDFITYWGPVLQKEAFALVQFILDENYDKNIAALQVEPSPDAVRRVFMLCTTLESNNPGIAIEPQQLNGFERNGFTLVEWGGSEIPLDIIIP